MKKYQNQKLLMLQHMLDNHYGWPIQNKHFFIDIFQPTRKLHYFSVIFHSKISLQSNFFAIFIALNYYTPFFNTHNVP